MTTTTLLVDPTSSLCAPLKAMRQLQRGGERLHVIERRELRVGGAGRVDVLATQTSIACVYVAHAEETPSIMFGRKGGARVNLVMFNASKMTPDEIFRAQLAVDWNVMVSLVNTPDEACEFIISLAQACQDEGRKANATGMIEGAFAAAFHLAGEEPEASRRASFQIASNIGEYFVRSPGVTTSRNSRDTKKMMMMSGARSPTESSGGEDHVILLESFGSLDELARHATSPEEVMRRTPLSDENSRRAFLILNGGDD